MLPYLQNPNGKETKDILKNSIITTLHLLSKGVRALHLCLVFITPSFFTMIGFFFGTVILDKSMRDINSQKHCTSIYPICLQSCNRPGRSTSKSTPLTILNFKLDSYHSPTSSIPLSLILEADSQFAECNITPNANSHVGQLQWTINRNHCFAHLPKQVSSFSLNNISPILANCFFHGRLCLQPIQTKHSLILESYAI